MKTQIDAITRRWRDRFEAAATAKTPRAVEQVRAATGNGEGNGEDYHPAERHDYFDGEDAEIRTEDGGEDAGAIVIQRVP